MIRQERAFQAQPDSAQYYYDLAIACGKSNRHREAIKAFKEAILLKPDHAEAHYNLAITYLILRNKDAALLEYSVLKSIDQEKALWLFELIHV